MDDLPRDSNAQLRKLVDFLSIERLIDFSAYDPALLLRRIKMRQSSCDRPELDSYLAFLQEHQEEVNILLDTISITASHFFRNALTFALIKERIIPALFAQAGREGGVRIWCAGCAQGEEAYSIAILLHEHRQRESLATPVMILATDIDRESLAIASRAWYRPESIEETSKRHLERYFFAENGGYRLTDEIRAMVTFAWHDLASGSAPQEGIFSDYQLILCRNVLIYFRRDRGVLIQRQLAGHLRPGGWLILGEAETLRPELAAMMQDEFPGTHVFRRERIDA